MAKIKGKVINHCNSCEHCYESYYEYDTGYREYECKLLEMFGYKTINRVSDYRTIYCHEDICPLNVTYEVK